MTATTIEKTAPIGSDWPQYLDLLATDKAIAALKGDHPMALELLQAKRSQLKKLLQAELDIREGRYIDANNQRRSAIENATPISEYERFITEGAVEVERLNTVIAGFDAYEAFQSQWDGQEPRKRDELLQRIECWKQAIIDHPTKQARYRQQAIPAFIQIPEAP